MSGDVRGYRCMACGTSWVCDIRNRSSHRTLHAELAKHPDSDAEWVDVAFDPGRGWIEISTGAVFA